MDIDEIRARFTPAVQEIIEQCRVTEDFVDKDLFRVYMATIWGNAVLEPKKTGIEESELEVLHDFLNEEIERLLGHDETITGIFEYIVSKEGEESLARLSLSQRHKDFLLYFARLILSPELGTD